MSLVAQLSHSVITFTKKNDLQSNVAYIFLWIYVLRETEHPKTILSYEMYNTHHFIHKILMKSCGVDYKLLKNAMKLVLTTVHTPFTEVHKYS